MAKSIQGKKVAILTGDGFEEVELIRPMKALQEAGALVHVIAPQGGQVRGWDHDHWSAELPVDVPLGQAVPEEYDALVLPGGVLNADSLRRNADCVAFVQHFLEQGKPVAAICHAPQLLIETGMISGREMTSAPSIKTDLRNAGVNWVDREVALDNGLVTSRGPNDLDAFNRQLLEEIGEGLHPTTAQFTHADHQH